MTFTEAVELVLEQEGTMSDHPDDAGGLTKYGISSASYPEVTSPDFDQLKALAIYRRDFWFHFKCDQMPDGINLLFFDATVNQTRQCTRLLQQSLKVRADGIIGPITLTAVKQASQHELLNEFAARRAVAYANHAKVRTFGLGWYRRLMDMTHAAHAIVA